MEVEILARLIFGAAGFLLLGVILFLVQRGSIKEKHSLLWVPMGVVFFFFGLFPRLLVNFSNAINLHYITVVLLFVVVVYTFILIYLTINLSKLREDIQRLAQEQALIRAKPSSLKNGSSNMSNGTKKMKSIKKKSEAAHSTKFK